MAPTNTIRKVLIIFLAAGTVASADVSILIQEAVGGSGEFTGSGHAALYFSGLCAETPVKLRVCREGEKGVVLSAYPGWGAKIPYKWLALPLNAFLYGVESKNDIPLYANGEIRRLLREEYRKKFLRDIIPDVLDGSVPEGRWTQTIGSTINRDIYGLRVKTTTEQDAEFLENFSKIPNTHVFSTMSSNCADFVRETINMVFPGATHRDVVNDFGMTTPKALARSFTEYASARPDLLFRIDKYPQIDGPVQRSINNRNFTEKALVSKKYALLMVTTKPEIAGIFAVTYLLTGWYNLGGQYHQRPTLEVAELKLSATQPASNVFRTNLLPSASVPVQTKRAQFEKQLKTLRLGLFGSNELWNGYRNKFKPILERALEDKLFLDDAELRTFYKDLELQSEPTLDSKGRVILTVEDRGVIRTLGVTRTNIEDSESDPTLAYKLMLAKVNYILSAPSRNRVSAPEFETDWTLLLSLDSKVRSSAMRSLDSAGTPVKQPRFRQKQEIVSGSRRAQKLLIAITH